MKNVLISNQTKINDPILKEFTDQVTDTILMSINNQLIHKYKSNSIDYTARNFSVGGKKKVKSVSAAEVILKHLKSAKTSDPKVLTKNFYRASLSGINSKYKYQDLLNLKKKELSYNEKEVKALFKNVPLKKITKNYLSDIIKNLATVTETTSNTAVINKGLELQLAEVRCINDTNWEPGTDEISMGAMFIDADGNDSSHNEFRVSNGFRPGRTKSYAPKILKRFQIGASAFPQTYVAILSMAEKDAGGFSTFLAELYEAIKGEVQVILSAIGAAAGAYIGAAVGGSLGTAIAGPVGTIIGIVAGAVLGALVALLTNALKDDVFTPQTETITIPSADFLFPNGSETSNYYYSNFSDHGGDYRVKYRWKVNR